MQAEKKVTRRTFMTGAGALALGAAAFSGVASADEDGAPTYADTVAWDTEYNVVVVGFGGAGASAAITAADAGAKVLLVEKAPLGDEGGNTRYCEQAILWFDDYDGGMQFMRSMTAGYSSATEEVLDFMVRGSMENSDWIVSLGGEEISGAADVSAYGFTLDGPYGDWIADDGIHFSEYPERIKAGGDHAIIGFIGGYDNGQKRYWRTVRQAVCDRLDSIDVWFESPATGLVQDPVSKAVIGLSVERGGETVMVRALNGVVLACGSYEANGRKYEDYACLPECYPMGSLYNTGDGIDMALAAGADLWHMASLSGPWIAPKYPDQNRTYFCGMTQRMTVSGNCIYVGGDGTRFMNESGWQKHGHVDYSGTWKSQVCPDVMWAVYDQTGAGSGVGGSASIEESLIVSADSIEGLAEAIGIDPESLSATVARWNGYVDAGFDEQFERHTSTLAKVETAPFYALRLYPGCVNCQGGPRRNVSCEVLDTAGEPIPHLYSAGELGSFWTDVYCGGGNVAETMYTGRTAGANAAAEKNPLPALTFAAVESSPAALGNDLADALVASNEITLAEGERLGTASGLHGDVKVKVLVEDGRPAAVEIVEQHETEGLTDDVWSLMPTAMVEAGTADVDTVAGATISSNALISAVKDALAQG